MGDGLLQGFARLLYRRHHHRGHARVSCCHQPDHDARGGARHAAFHLAAGAIAKLSNKSFTAQQRIQGKVEVIEEYVGERKLVDAFAYSRCDSASMSSMPSSTAGESARRFMGSAF